MKIRNKIKGFWSKEKCEYCEGNIVEKEVEVYRKFGRKYAVIKNVPAGVCLSCGTRYYSANVLKLFQQVAKGQFKIRRELEVPVYSLS